MFCWNFFVKILVVVVLCGFLVGFVFFFCGVECLVVGGGVFCLFLCLCVISFFFFLKWGRVVGGGLLLCFLVYYDLNWGGVMYV